MTRKRKDISSSTSQNGGKETNENISGKRNRRRRGRGLKRNRQVWAIEVSGVKATAKLMHDLERYFIKRVCPDEERLVAKRFVLDSSLKGTEAWKSYYFEFRTREQQQAALKLSGPGFGTAIMRIRPWIVKESDDNNNEQDSDAENCQPPSPDGVDNDLQSSPSPLESSLAEVENNERSEARNENQSSHIEDGGAHRHFMKQSRKAWAIEVSGVKPTAKLMHDLERFFIRRVCPAENNLVSSRFVDSTENRFSSSRATSDGEKLFYFEFRTQSQQQAALKLDGHHFGGVPTLTIRPWVVKESMEKKNERETDVKESRPPCPHAPSEAQKISEPTSSIDETINCLPKDKEPSVYHLKAELEGKERLLAAANEHIKVLTGTNRNYEKRIEDQFDQIADQLDQIADLKGRIQSQAAVDKSEPTVTDVLGRMDANLKNDSQKNNAELTQSSLERSTVSESRLVGLVPGGIHKGVERLRTDEDPASLRATIEALKIDLMDTIVLRDNDVEEKMKMQREMHNQLGSAARENENLRKQLNDSMKENAALHVVFAAKEKAIKQNINIVEAELVSLRGENTNLMRKVLAKNDVEMELHDKLKVAEQDIVSLKETIRTLKEEMRKGDANVQPRARKVEEGLDGKETAGTSPPQNDRDMENLEAKLVKALQDQDRLLEENQQLRRDKQNMQQKIGSMSLDVEENKHLKEEIEELREELEQMRANQAMEQGFMAG